MHYTVAFFFWVAFLIPGFAMVMRWSPGLTKGGLMSTIAVSFLGTVAILMPFTIIGFLLNLPVMAVSILIVGAVLWGLFDIVKTGVWKNWKDQCASIVRLETLVIAVGCGILGKMGTLMGADALIHMARVRQFLDHGLTNVDPFIKGDHFYPIYHTNVFHAILASCSQLTQVHYLDVWFGALPVFLVLIASAIYFMTYQVFANRWASWFCAIFFVVDQGHINFLPYPNKISPFFLIPILVGFTIRALRKKNPETRDAVQIGIVSLALGMFHGMYAFFGAILVGPVFTIMAVRSFFKKERATKKYALCMLALLLSLPWPIISRRVQDGTSNETIRARIERDRDPDAIHFATAKTGRAKERSQDSKTKNVFFIDTPLGIMKKPFRGFGGGKGIFGIAGFRYQYLVLGLLLGLFSKRRKQFLIAASVSVMTLSYLLFPPFCTLLFNIMEAKWMLQRLETAGLSMMFPTLVFGAIVFHLHRFLNAAADASMLKRVRTTVLQGVVSLLLLSFAFSYSGQWKSWHAVTSGSPWASTRFSWYENYRIVDEYTAKQCQSKVRAMKRQRKFYQEKIPPGSNVIVTDNMALELVTLYDAHILDPIRSSVGVPDLSYYRRLNKRIINPMTKWDTRKRILKQVGTTLYLPQRKTRWLDGHVKNYWGMRQGTVKLVEIDLDK